jgi:hypothetical protein
MILISNLYANCTRHINLFYFKQKNNKNIQTKHRIDANASKNHKQHFDFDLD